MDMVNEKQFAALKDEVEQQNDQLKLQQEMLSQLNGEIKQLRETADLLAEAVIGLAKLGYLGLILNSPEGQAMKHKILTSALVLEQQRQPSVKP
jgi:hypothetical protein